MLKSWRRYARFFGPDVDRDVEEELRFHVDALVDEYVARGLPRTAAEAAARERLGDLRMIERHLKAHDRSRVRRSAWADTIPALWRDIRLALRSLRRSPTFTAATIAILAIAIGMSTAMSTIFKTVLIDRLPVIAQDRLVVMHPLDRRGTHLDVPYPYLAEMARDTAVFRGVAGVYHLGAQSVPFMSQGSPVQLNMASASPNYFDVFGLRPAAGRLFRREDGQAGAPVVMVLSYAAWRQRFGGDPHAIGRTLIDPYTQQPVRIVGVAPPGFEYPTGAEAWEQVGPDFTAQVDIIARLSPGVTTDAARAALFAMAQRSNPFVLEAPHKPIAISGVAVQGFTDTVLGSSRPALVALMLAVALLLVIACINVGNLVLVRLMSRHREIAVRRAIGASSGDIARLFGVESAILGIAGGLLGLGMAFVTLRVVSAAGPVSLPRADALGVAQAPLGVAALITVVAMLAFGLGPSLIASRVTSYSTLRSDSRSGTEGTARRRTRRWLVAWQMALAVVMLTGASLLVRTLARLQSVDLGYTPEHLSLLAFTGPRSVLATQQQIFEAGQALVASLAVTPGVVAATPVEQAPFKGQSFFIMPIARAEDELSDRARRPWVPFELVGPDYFRTFEIAIRRGRGFSSSDTRGSDRVAVISETLARQLWPNEDAVGKRLVRGRNDTTWTVIGVANDTHFRELRNTGPVIYFDWNQIEPFFNGLVAVRTTTRLATILPALRAATHDANPSLVLFDAQTMDQFLEGPLAQPRLSALLMTVFSLVALLLSAIGLYGVMASAVRQQSRDIGVRVALGATPSDVRRLVLGDAIRVVGAGAAIGLAGALVAGRLLASQLFGVGPIDPISLSAATCTLVVIGIGAAYLPARRATLIDPVQSLRAD